MPPQTQAVDPHFTVFIRLPFPRGDFVDPPPADWNPSKDRVLWDVLSQTSKEKDVDWKALADHFDVTLPFLLQQAAWLYDRQLSQVRAQIRRVGSQQPIQGPTPSAGGTPGGSQPMTRGGSGGGSRIPSRLSLRQRDSPAPRHDSSAPPTPIMSKGPTRRSSAPRTESPRDIPTTQQRSSRRSSNEAAHPTIRRESRLPALPPFSPPPDDESSEPLSSSSSASSSEPEDISRRAAPFKRFGKFSVHNKLGTSSNEGDDEEEDSPAFLPFENETPQEDINPQSHNTPRPTLPDDSRRTTRKQVPLLEQATSSNKPSIPESSASSTSSGMATGSPANDGQRANRHIGALSPRRAAELAKSSPRGRGSRREGSDGSPSMGSSFSDLDDASVSQSALEEAFLSKHGGVASRMSTISQALRSRYL